MKLHELQAQHRSYEAAKRDAETRIAFMAEFNGYLKEFSAESPTLGLEWYEHLSSQVNPKFGMKNLALDVFVTIQKRGIHSYNDKIS